MELTKKEYEDLKTLITLLEKIDRGDYFNEDDDKMNWREALHRIQEEFYSFDMEEEHGN